MAFHVRVLTWWIIYAAAAACAGWLLSSIGQLNRAGYATIAIILVIAVWLAPRGRVRRRRFVRRRWRRPLPIVFLVLATLSFLGGAIHAPNNYDMLTYRLPRLLQWASQDRWHWIHTNIDRMNYSAAGFEWATAPLFMLTHNAQPFFILNVVAFLLLPGLVFGVFRQLGVTRRAAWTWMWLLPAGYCFAMQAGSAGNDTIAATYLLVALFFAGKARQTGRPAFAYLSIMSAALLSAVKASNLPLLLPCAIALLPSIRLLIAPPRRLMMTLVIVLMSVASSFVPTAVLNHRMTGDWAGSPGDPGRLKAGSALGGFVGNFYQIIWASLEPPLLPVPHLLNGVIDASVPTPVRTLLDRDFPRFSAGMGEMPAEERSGLGAGVALSAVLLLGGSLFVRGLSSRPANLLGHAIIGAGIVAMLAFMVSLASEAGPRLAAPYYPLLIAGCAILPGAELVARMRWWRAIAILSAASIIPAMILTPSRPLWPAQRVLAWLSDRFPRTHSFDRPRKVYDVYSRRADSLAPIRVALPADCQVVGLLCGIDDSDVSLWQPWGARRVAHVTIQDDPAALRQRGIQCLVVSADGLALSGKNSIDDLLILTGGTLIHSEKLIQKVSQGELDWFVIRL